MDDKKVFSKLLTALLVGLISVGGTLLLLSYEASARPMLQPDADLAIAKAASPARAVAGEVLTYTLTVTNEGPSGTTGITVTDTLPPGVTYDSASPDCDNPDGAVTCILETLDISGTATFTILVTVKSSTTGTLFNSATVTATTTDSDTLDNEATINTSVDTKADLVIAKTDNPAPVVAGEALTYTLTITNNGPSDTTGVQVTDTLPSGVILGSTTPSQGDPCNEADTTITCILGTLNAGNSATVTIIVTPTVSGTIVNTAEVSASEPDDTLDNNTYTITTTVNPGADLSVTKNDLPDPVTAGTALTYALVITNNGPSDATGVRVTDTLPSGVTFGSATPSQGDYNSGTGVWTVDNLTHTHSATLTIVVTVAPSARGTITNSAQVSANEADIQPANNTVKEPTSVNARSDLAITKTGNPDPVIAGTALTYTLTITNNGPSDATSVRVTDTLPSGVTFGSATPSQGTYSSATGVWAVGSLTGGGSATLALIVTVAPSTRGTITNQATVAANETDTQTTNNTAAASTLVNARADLAVAKADAPDPVIAGTSLTYTLTVTNYGPSDATGVTLTDTLPSGVTFGSATPSQGTYNSATGVWAVGSLTGGGSATLALTVTVAPSTRGTITNSARVSANETDTQSANNTVAAGTLVNARADLAVAKADAPDPVIAGTSLTYTLTITNRGPSDVTGVTLTDTLPSGVTFGSATPSQGSYNSTTGVWAVGNLAYNHTANIAIRVNVRSSTTGMLSNSATASGNENDPAPSNNTATQNTQVNTQANLTITKSSPATVNAGDPLTYTITFTNSGPSDATSIVITDTLDPNLDYVSASPTPAGFIYGGDPYWTFARLEPDHLNQIVLRVQVHTPLTNNITLTNTAWLDADQIAPLSTTQRTTVHSRPVLMITKDDDPDPVNAGEILVYTVVITNSGNENATAVTVVETYDPNVSLVYANPEPDIGSGGRVWTFDYLNMAHPQTIDIVVRVTDTLAVGTVLTNQVMVSSTQTTPITDTAVTSVTSASELTVAKIDVPDPVEAGEELLYFVSYGNSGTAPAANVVITETYDSRVTFVSAAPAPKAGTNNVWDIGYLAVGKSGVIVVTVLVDTPLPNGTILTDRVTIDSAHTSPKTFTETTTVSSVPDLILYVADYPDPVAAGAPLTYTLRYTNTGNADATHAVITATFDSHVSFSGATPPPRPGSGQVRYWDVNTITGEGGSGQIVIRVNVTSPLANGTQLEFGAQLGDAEGDLVPATAQTMVTSKPVLLLDKNDGVDTVYAGNLLTYTLTYSNTGNENASNVTITDTLPDYVTYVGCGIQNGACSPIPPVQPDQVIFHIPIITQTVGRARLVVRVNDPLPADANLVINQASMAHPSLSAPIDAHDRDTIGTYPNLQITVTNKPELFSPGKLMTYTVTYSNVGRMDARDVVITTTLPTNTVYSGYGWQPAGGRTYTRTASSYLPAGSAGHTVTFTVQYSAPVQSGCPQIGVSEFKTPFTIAGKGGVGRDANPADNTAIAYIGVPDLVVTKFTVEPSPVVPNVPVTFTIVMKNQGTGWATNPDVQTGKAGSGVDIFIAPTASCPNEEYGYDALWDYIPFIAPGANYTLVMTLTGNISPALRHIITFTEQEIQQIQEFYVKVDSFTNYPYGLIPESNEMNNVVSPADTWPYHIYLPLALRNRQ